jgi:hypothetical protein
VFFLNCVGFVGVSFAVSSDSESSDSLGGNPEDAGELALALPEKEFKDFCDTTFSIKERKLFEGGELAGDATEHRTTKVRWINDLSALHQAVLYVNLDLCKRVLRVNPKLIESRDAAGFSVFAYALVCGSIEIAEFFLGIKPAFLKDTVNICYHQDNRAVLAIGHDFLETQYAIVLPVIYDRADTVKWFFESCIEKSHSLFLDILQNSFKKTDKNDFTHNLLVTAAGLCSPKSEKYMLELLNALPPEVLKDFLKRRSAGGSNLLYHVADVLLKGPCFLEGNNSYTNHYSYLEELFRAILEMDELLGFTCVGQTSQNKKIEEVGKSLIARLILSKSKKPEYSLNVRKNAVALLKIMQQVMSSSEKKANILGVLDKTGHGKTAWELAGEVEESEFKTEVVAILKQIEQECRSALDQPVIDSVAQQDVSQRGQEADLGPSLERHLPPVPDLSLAEQASGSNQRLGGKGSEQQIAFDESNKNLVETLKRGFKASLKEIEKVAEELVEQAAQDFFKILGQGGSRFLGASMRSNDGSQQNDGPEASQRRGAGLKPNSSVRAMLPEPVLVPALVSVGQGSGSSPRSLDNGSALQFSRGIPSGDPEGFFAGLRDFPVDSKESLDDLWKFLETEAKNPDAFAKLVQTVDSAGNNMFHILASRFEGRLTQDSREFLGKFVRLLSAEQMVFSFFQENLEKQ